MNRTKAWFVALIIMTLAGGLLYGLWAWAIVTYRTVIQVLGLYGFLMIGISLERWLEIPEYLPMEEQVRRNEQERMADDAKLWEQR